MIGSKLGSYEVVQKLGEGGMGAVYLAKHHLLGRKAAVKVLLPELSEKKEVVERFFDEARAATLIEHGGIVDVFDFGVADSGAYIVMEFLDGESLSDRMQRLGKMPQADVIRLGRQAASALAAAHREGIVHRDLKPDNLIVAPDSDMPGGERIKVLDFGIAKLTSDDAGAARKTRTGMIMGTPHYMSPEQCQGAGGKVDGRVDVYALGCLLYEMLCGCPPFDGQGVGQIIAKHIYEQPEAPRAYVPEISEALESLVLCCLAKQPDDRFASMDALVAAFDNLSRHRYASATDALPPTSETVVLSPHTAAGSGSHAVPGASGQTPSTTLRASSGQIVTAPQAARPGRRFAIIGTSVIAVGAIAAIAVAMVGAGDSHDRVAASGERGDESAEKEPVAAVKAEADAAPVTEPAAPPPDATPAPADVTFEIASEPAGAAVFGEAGDALGETPLELEVERGDEPAEFTLRAAGHKEATLELIADRDREEFVTLERQAPRRPARTERRQTQTTDSARDQAPQRPERERSPPDDDDSDFDPFGSR